VLLSATDDVLLAGAWLPGATTSAYMSVIVSPPLDWLEVGDPEDVTGALTTVRELELGLEVRVDLDPESLA
jgi:hypothetical protein